MSIHKKSVSVSRVLLSLVLVTSFGSVACAVPIAITNFDFEDATTTITGPIPDWVETPETGSTGVYDFNGLISPRNTSPGVGDRFSAFMNTIASVSQTTSEVIVPNRTYTLQADFGDRNDQPGGRYTLSIYKDTIANILASTSIDTSIMFPNNADNGWVQDVSVSYQATAADAGSMLGVMFSRVGGGIGAVDYIRLDFQGPPPAPEPGTCCLLAGGMLLLVRSRRRKA